MKTTIDISDGLLRQAKDIARREGTTVRALVESGLRAVIKERRTQPTFTLREASFGGRGLTSEFRHARWNEIRDAAYEDQGT